MDPKIYDLHMEAGRICGWENTCMGKIPYDEEWQAILASMGHNMWDEKIHNCSHYPCYFCKLWHLGKGFSEEQMIEMIKYSREGV